MIRIIVFDTNVLISALLAPASASSAALRRALRDDTVVYSESTLAELAAKIRLPRFDKYQPLSRRLAFYYDYEMNAYPINITHKIQACRDPKDDQFLELAKSANADCIVTKDNDLLVLHPFEGIPILGVTHFLNWG
jgi:uncharacterized protein